MIGFVYMTTCHINNKKYIGSCLYSRKACSWKTYLGSGKLLRADMKKYGKEHFSKIILEESDDLDKLRKLEEFYILAYDAVNSKDFYNMKYASMGGDTYTMQDNDSKLKIKAKKSKSLSGMNNPMYGKKKTSKMIDAVKSSNSTQILYKGREYSSFSQAMRDLGIIRRSEQVRFRNRFDDPSDLECQIISYRKCQQSKY